MGDSAFDDVSAGDDPLLAVLADLQEAFLGEVQKGAGDPFARGEANVDGVAGSLDQAVRIASGEEVMIIGGGQIYEQALPFSDRMILTLVECDPEADTWFPEWQNSDWRQISLRSESADERNPYAYQVIEWVRKTDSGDTSPAPGTVADPPA